jgi:hypothetical protein
MPHLASDLSLGVECTICRSRGRVAAEPADHLGPIMGSVTTSTPIEAKRHL